MNKHAIVLTISGCISIICLSAGYIIHRDWLHLSVFLLMAIIWFVGKKYSQFWSTTSILAAYVILAAIGIQSGFSTPLIIFGCVAALVSWETINFIGSHNNTSHHTQNRNFENRHLRSLGAVVLLGITVPTAASFIQLKLNFGMVVSFIILGAGSFIFAAHNFLKN